MYETTSLKKQKVEPDNCMMLPIKNQKGRVIGVLEISNITIDLFGCDEEYFGIVLANFCGQKIVECVKYKLLKEEIMFKNHLFDAYLYFCKAESYYDLTEKIIEWASKIFGYDRIKIMFVQDD